MPRPKSKYDALYKKYSFLSNVRMFECGDGWFDLLSELCAKLKALKLGPAFAVYQIKEKFGTLRFYFSDYLDNKSREVEKLISEATKKSAKTCECCGQPGKLVSLKRGCYITTLCKKCEAEANKK